MTVRKARAFAKINLTLDIGALRPDGYHDIRSIMQTIDLHDTVEIGESARPGVSLAVSGEFAADTPSDPTNLVVRAAEAMLAEDRPQRGVSIDLVKRIPAQAGLGGGSSDAAATLRLMNALRRDPLPMRDLTAIAAGIGADVPYFLHGGPCLVEGLGEQVTPLQPVPVLSVVVAKPAGGVSTKAAYAAVDSIPGRTPRGATDAWLTGDKSSRHMALHNDFDRAVIPQSAAIDGLHRRLADAALRYGQRPPHLCGSGAALFVVCSNRPMIDIFLQAVGAFGDARVWFTNTVSAEAFHAE